MKYRGCLCFALTLALLCCAPLAAGAESAEELYDRAVEDAKTIEPEELLPLLTENPARLIGVFDRKGSIAPGKDADLVVLDSENRVNAVFLRGRRFQPA